MLVLLLMANNSYSATIYTDRVSWESHLSAITTEKFTDSSLDGVIFLGSGVADAYGASDMFFGRVGNSSSDQIDWSFGSSIYAFGGDWNLAPGGNGGGVTVLTDSTQVGVIADTYTGGFWGVISDTAFSTVTLTNVGTGTEAFTLDNLSFSHIAPVPVPPAFWLFLGGAMVIFGLNKQKKGTLVSV